MHRSEQGRDGPPGIVSARRHYCPPPNRISKGPPRELESMLERYKHSCVRFPFALIVELQRLTERRMEYPNPGAQNNAGGKSGLKSEFHTLFVTGHVRASGDAILTSS